MSHMTSTKQKTGWRALPRNVWAVSLTSFFMDISSEMVLNILPLFLSTSLAGCRTDCGHENGWLSLAMAFRRLPSRSFILPTPGQQC